MRIEKYTPDQQFAWDAFVHTSKNGTFLFFRDYMDYHANRFRDHSLMIYSGKDQLIGLLPASQHDDEIRSHGGLTYGGLITSDKMTTERMLEIFEIMLGWLRLNGFRTLVYKAIPHIYHRYPADEDLYALYLHKAHLKQRSVLTVVKMQHPLDFQQRRKRGADKARKAGTSTVLSDDLPAYWQLLEVVLSENHDASPVHSLDEITLLHSRYPDHIKLYGAFRASTMTAGVLIYENEQVVRSQYIAVDESGRETGALDLLFEYLLKTVYRHKLYFDFGTSEDPATRMLNSGLIAQKEGFGARAVVQDIYTIDLNGLSP